MNKIKCVAVIKFLSHLEHFEHFQIILQLNLILLNNEPFNENKNVMINWFHKFYIKVLE